MLAVDDRCQCQSVCAPLELLGGAVGRSVGSDRMTPFEYATGLFSIVIGLGVARVLGGIGTFITTRDRSASDWIVASWWQ